MRSGRPERQTLSEPDFQILEAGAADGRRKTQYCWLADVGKCCSLADGCIHDAVRIVEDNVSDFAIRLPQLRSHCSNDFNNIATIQATRFTTRISIHSRKSL